MTNRTDAFTRADSTTSLGTPTDGGSAWVADSGTWGITSNRAYKVASGATFQVATLQASVANVEVQATEAVLGGTKIVGLTARVASDTDYLMTEVDNSGVQTSIYLFKKVANTFTQLAVNTSFTLVAGDVLKLRVDGANLITVFRNGTSLTSATDSAGSTNTKHGLLGYDIGTATSTLPDDFSITAIDDMPPSCVYFGDEVTEEDDPAPLAFFADAPMDVLPPISPELPQSFEWEDPNETEAALWPDYWAQAPPIPNAAAETGGQSNEDSSAQLPDEDEDFGFAQDGIAPPDQIFVEDASNQLEDQDEDFGFLASPLDVPVAADLISTEDSDGQLEEVEDDASFYDQPLPADVVSDQVFTEDADAQTEELEEDFGFSDAPLPDEHDLGAQHIEQPGEDEEVEGFADAPAETVDPSLIAPECADNQVDVEDELFGFSHAPPPDPLPCAAAVFPPANQVLSGVVYGPNGNDYTGTMTQGAGTGGVYLRRR